MPAFSKVSNIVGFSAMCFIKTTAIRTCGIAAIETPKAYFLTASLPFSRLIFKAVMFNMLGVIEPAKEKKNPKKKREMKIIYKKISLVNIPLKTKLHKKNASKNLMRLYILTSKIYVIYTTPCANIASATFTKPAIFAPLM